MDTQQVKHIEFQGQQIPLFTPLNDVKLAVVSLDVLLHLTKLLGTEKFVDIKLELLAELDNTTTLEQAVAVCDAFSNFNKSVNLIAHYKLPDTKPSEEYAQAH